MVDSLGHPITAGCTVLTSGYWNTVMDVVIIVKKVTPCYVHVEMECNVWNYETRKAVPQMKTLRRRPHQVLVIDKQLKYNRKAYPEHQL